METGGQDFGMRLHRLRIESGLSQKQVGAMLGVTRRTIQNWEYGLAQPKPNALPQVAAIFGVTATVFFIPEDEFRRVCLEIRERYLIGADNLSIQLDLFGVIRPYTPFATQHFALAESA